MGADGTEADARAGQWHVVVISAQEDLGARSTSPPQPVVERKRDARRTQSASQYGDNSRATGSTPHHSLPSRTITSIEPLPDETNTPQAIHAPHGIDDGLGLHGLRGQMRTCNCRAPSSDIDIDT